MKTIRRYLWREIASATLFVLFSLLSLFLFFDMVAQLDEIGQRGFRFRDALFYVALTLPSRTYELMPIAALIGTIYALSKLAANSEFTIMRVSGMSTRRLVYSLIGIGLVIVALTYVLGEFISPPAEQLAQKARLQATGSPISVREFRSGVWVRDVVKEPGGGVAAFRFINVRQVAPDGNTRDWRVFEFDRDYKLHSIMTAETGRYLPGAGWTLFNVVETRLPGPIASATVTQMKAVRTEVLRSRTTSMAVGIEAGYFRRDDRATRAYGGLGSRAIHPALGGQPPTNRTL